MKLILEMLLEVLINPSSRTILGHFTASTMTPTGV